MELKVDLPALAGKDIDPAAFQRVWNRVMPGQAAPREGEAPPVTPPDTSVPAEPSIPPEEVPPTAPDLPPVPECQADTPPDQPDLPAVPDCPPQSECPDCPACPDCPQCPDTPPVSPPALCLGEMSQGDSGRLEELMSLVQSGAAAGRVLRQGSGRPGPGPPAGLPPAVRRLLSPHRKALHAPMRRPLSASFSASGPPAAVCLGAAVGTEKQAGRSGHSRPLPEGALSGAGSGGRLPRRNNSVTAGADVNELPSMSGMEGP